MVWVVSGRLFLGVGHVLRLCKLLRKFPLRDYRSGGILSPPFSYRAAQYAKGHKVDDTIKEPESAFRQPNSRSQRICQHRLILRQKSSFHTQYLVARVCLHSMYFIALTQSDHLGISLFEAHTWFICCKQLFSLTRMQDHYYLQCQLEERNYNATNSKKETTTYSRWRRSDSCLSTDWNVLWSHCKTIPRCVTFSSWISCSKGSSYIQVFISRVLASQ